MITSLLAAQLLLGLLALLLLFHLLVVADFVPYDLVWAGKIKDRRELLRMEIISFTVLLLTGAVVSMKIGYLPALLPANALQIGLWVIFVFFCLNTLGNLTAKNPIERYGFGLLTLLMALLALRLALG